MNLRLAILMPTYDTVEIQTMLSLQSLMLPSCEVSTHFAHGLLLDHARYWMTEKALATDPTHFMLIDADMVFGAYSVAQLLVHRKPIIGGLCFERRPPHNPTIYREGKVVLDYPPNEVIEVEATGGGFLLIAREVMDAVIARVGIMDAWQGLIGKAGDVEFIRRARECGFQCYVDTGCKIGHIGKLVIDEAFHKRYRAQVETAP